MTSQNRWMRPALTVLAMVSCVSCARTPNDDTATPRTGVSALEIGPETEKIKRAAVQTIYIPVYPEVATADQAHLYPLAITLCVRNTDRTRPIVVVAVKYYDQGGKLVRDLLKAPVRVAPWRRPSSSSASRTPPAVARRVA